MIITDAMARNFGRVADTLFTASSALAETFEILATSLGEIRYQIEAEYLVETTDTRKYLHVGPFTIEVQPKPYNTPKKRSKLNTAATHQVTDRKISKQKAHYRYKNYRGRV